MGHQLRELDPLILLVSALCPMIGFNTTATPPFYPGPRGLFFFRAKHSFHKHILISVAAALRKASPKKHCVVTDRFPSLLGLKNRRMDNSATANFGG